MNIISKTIRNLFRSLSDDSRTVVIGGPYPNSINPDADSVHISIYNANNGKVVEFSNNNDSRPKLYIINDGDDLGQELSKILTLERLAQ